jgi:hypothetical protein
MKITVIRYRRLQSHEFGYGHDAVEAEAQIDEGEDAESALGELKLWVNQRLDGIREVDRHVRTLQTLREQVVSHENERDQLAREIKANRKVIAEHENLAALARENGIDVEAANLIDDGIPF